MILLALPGIEADVMMIPSGADKRRLIAIALRQFKTEDAAIKGQSPIQIRHFEVNMSDPNPGIKGRRYSRLP